MIGIDAEAAKTKQHIACKVSGHFFIGPDTGIFSLMFPNLKMIKLLL